MVFFIHFMLMAKSKSVKMKEALSDPKWIYAIKEESKLIVKNNTRELIDLPQGKMPIVVMWVYKVKEKSKGRNSFSI